MSPMLQIYAVSRDPPFEGTLGLKSMFFRLLLLFFLCSPLSSSIPATHTHRPLPFYVVTFHILLSFSSMFSTPSTVLKNLVAAFYNFSRLFVLSLYLTYCFHGHEQQAFTNVHNSGSKRISQSNVKRALL